MTERNSTTVADLPVVYLTRAQVCEMLHVGMSTVKIWAQQGIGPKFYKIGGNRVVYRFDEVVAWVEAGGVGGE